MAATCSEPSPIQHTYVAQKHQHGQQSSVHEHQGLEVFTLNKCAPGNAVQVQLSTAGAKGTRKPSAQEAGIAGTAEEGRAGQEEACHTRTAQAGQEVGRQEVGRAAHSQERPGERLRRVAGRRQEGRRQQGGHSRRVEVGSRQVQVRSRWSCSL